MDVPITPAGERAAEARNAPGQEPFPENALATTFPFTNWIVMETPPVVQVAVVPPTEPTVMLLDSVGLPRRAVTSSSAIPIRTPS